MPSPDRRPPRVIHAPYDVGGNAYYLAQAERKLRFDSRTMVYFRQWFGYPTDKHLRIRPGADPTRSLRWWSAMTRIALQADVLHFNFGGSFLTDVNRGRVFTDLAFWQRLGLATVVTFQGCDSRISSHCVDSFPVNACANCRSRPFCKTTYDPFRREVLSQVGRYFNQVFALNPDLLHHIPNGRFLPYSNCDLDAWTPPQGYDWRHGGPVRVLHAPTWRDIKGSDHIIRAVEELRAEGENVELILVENVPHQEARKLYETTDVLVDQVLAGWYGGLAVELMALGKPVIAYLRDGDLQFIPPKMREELPVQSAHPGTLKAVLRPLIRDAEARRHLGRRSREYAERWHHPDHVAAITTKAYHTALQQRTPPRSKSRRVAIAVKTSIPTVKEILALYCRCFPVGNILGRAVSATMQLLIWILLPIMRLLSWWRASVRGRLKSVWGTTPIVTLSKLAEADELLGVRSRTHVYTTYYITRQFDRSHQARIEWFARRLPHFLPAYYRFVLLVAMLRFDVFHYFYDQGFMERTGRFGVNRRELEWLRRAGKRSYLYAYGADVRTRRATQALGDYNCCTHCDSVGRHCICDDQENAEKQEFYRKNATACISMGDMTEYVPNARNIYYWPLDVDDVHYVGIDWDGVRPLRILHVPNHEWAKGSRYLQQAVEQLNREGSPIELIQAKNRPNSEILALMNKADVIADQFLIGWHGYTALEAMAIGKAVLCHIRDRRMLLAPDECPIISADPDNLIQVLKHILTWTPEKWKRVGEQGRSYVQRHFSVAAVARRLGQLYLDTAQLPSRARAALERNIAALQTPPGTATSAHSGGARRAA